MKPSQRLARAALTQAGWAGCAALGTFAAAIWAVVIFMPNPIGIIIASSITVGGTYVTANLVKDAAMTALRARYEARYERIEAELGDTRRQP